jgi:geranylgeranyl pyrophosphate synthase
MPFPSSELTLDQFKPLVDRRLKDILVTSRECARTINVQYAEVVIAVEDQLLRSGKRVRPYLTYLAYQACGGQRTDEIISAAAAQEFFHQFLLIHDDIIDRDSVRHGGLNIAGRYRRQFQENGVPKADANHYAMSVAMLAGDICNALAFHALEQTRADPELKLAAISRAHQMLIEVIGGEVTDVLGSMPGAPALTDEQILDMYRHKTASYTFCAPLQIGAILAGGSPKQQSHLEDYAGPLGRAFQLVDDLLGVFGDETAIGKPLLSDMREGKHTPLLAAGYNLATPAQAAVLRSHWGNRKAGTNELEQVREILRSSGAQDVVNAQIQGLLDESLAALAASDFPPISQAALRDLAEFSVRRRY